MLFIWLAFPTFPTFFKIIKITQKLKYIENQVIKKIY
jgi:hypothetical protein